MCAANLLQVYFNKIHSIYVLHVLPKLGKFTLFPDGQSSIQMVTGTLFLMITKAV